MGIFKGIKEWFFPKEYLEYRDSLAGVVAYLPPGDLNALVAWRNKHLPYRSDTDTGKPDGKYDPTQEYNGADLTIKMKGGDCESLAAFCSEVIREWKGWSTFHVLMYFVDRTDPKKTLKGHDIATFTTPSGKMGWIDGDVHWGNIHDMKKFYADEWGWDIKSWYTASDIGQKIEALP